MRKAEGELFGTASKPSPLDIEVEVHGKSQCVALSEPAYALFPFRESGARALERVCFVLSLRAPRAVPGNLQTELEAAVWAWVTFGGYGARTRRGCGALRCVDTACPKDAADLQQQAAKYVISGSPPDGVPSLSRAQVVAGKPVGDAVKAWCTAVGLYSNLRQGPGVGRSSGAAGNQTGRSRWPEADAIRHLSGQHAAVHRPEHPAGKAFPRADLGVPIIFHFKDPGEPSDYTLGIRTDNPGRMASPVITRPLALAGDSFAPMVVLLTTPHVWECPGGGLQVNGHKLGQGEVQSEPIARATPPLRELGAANAREAVIAFAEREWKTKAVTLP